MLQVARNLVHHKNTTIRARKIKEVKLETQLTELNEDGEIQPGCRVCTMLFGQRRKSDGPRIQGLKAGTATACSRLEQAQVSLKERADRLQERLAESRREAAALMKAGKKTEAIAAMKRAKIAEKQFLTASAAVDALDNQILALEEANLQREIATALSSSVKSVKKKTKGLLDKTEKAVDGSAEVKDLAEDVNSALEGLQPTNAPDEDELLVELQEMILDGEAQAEEAASTAPTVSEQTEKMKAWPSAPNKTVAASTRRPDGFHKLPFSAAQ